MASPSLAVLVIVAALPIIYLVVTSFTPLTLTNPRSAWNFSRPFGNYVLLGSDGRLHSSLLTQAVLSVTTVVLQLLLGLAAAMVLHTRKHGSDALRTALLIPMALPPIVVAIVWKMVYSPDISPVWQLFKSLGWTVPTPITDPNWALWSIIFADTWEWFPFTMLIVLAALKQIPEEWEEAARVDGASKPQLFFYVILPQLRSALLVAGLFRLIDSIKAFPLIYILTEGGPGDATEITNYYTFTQAFNFSYIGYSSAITVVLVILTALLSVMIVKLIEKPA
jgi:multiple sugar transport system permease protein